METNKFIRMAFLFVVGEYMAKGIAQGKLGLKICAVNNVVDAMQVASCQNSILKGSSGLLFIL